MKMEGETSLIKTNLTEWRFCLYPKYILLPIDENHDQVKNNVKNVIYSEVFNHNFSFHHLHHTSAYLSPLLNVDLPKFALNIPVFRNPHPDSTGNLT